MKIAIYLSTSAQGEDKFSIAAQEASIKSFAEKQGHTIAAMYVDEGAATSIASSKGFLRLMDDAKSKKFDAVVVKDMIRVTRNLNTPNAIADVLESYGIKLLSVVEDDLVVKSLDGDMRAFISTVNKMYARNMHMRRKQKRDNK